MNLIPVCIILILGPILKADHPLHYEDLQKKLWNLRNEFESNKLELEDQLLQIQNKLRKTNLELIQIKNSIQEKTTTPGIISYYTRTHAPIGWLKANGQSVSRTTYANLFSTIGTTFGSGDGSTTFNLPDLRSEFIRCWSDDRDVDINRKFASFQWGSIIPTVGYINGYDNRNILANAFQRELQFTKDTFDEGFEWNITPGDNRHGCNFFKRDTIGPIVYAVGDKLGNITTWNAYKGTIPRNIALLACIKY